MKRLPMITSFALFIALCVSVAFWSMRMFKPPQRAIAPPPPSQSVPGLEAAARLFGGRSSFAVTSNFQLTGVIVSGNPSESVAILAVNGQPAQAIRTNAEVVPGVTVKEVSKNYVFLLQGGVTKRIDLPVKGVAQPAILPNPIGASSQPVPPQMKADIPAKVIGKNSTPAVLPDPSYGSSLLGKYYKDRNAKLRKPPPPGR